jgi:DNA transformation protein and related proteins
MARSPAKQDPELEAGISTALELFARMGHLTVRKMFGGAGIYLDGYLFVLIGYGDIYLKADAASLGAYIKEACPPFIYEAPNGKHMEMSYRRMPESALDDASEALVWGRLGYEAARRSKK